MKPEDNPYTPGAGMPPPELSGRDDLLESIRSRGAQIGGAIASCANRAGYVLCAGHEDSPATDEF